MEPIDRHLLAGRSRRVVMLATAAGQEGDERIAYWNNLGRGHYSKLGADPIVCPVITRDDAFCDSYARLVDDAGLIYLSGGSPAYLAETLRDTPILERIVAAWHNGAALAGCSAGACALTAIAGGFRHLEHLGHPGLGLIGHLAVIPHFDVFDRRSPNLVGEVLERIPPGLTLVGVDENTALVTAEGASDEFVVMGEQSVWWIDRDARRHRFDPGTAIAIRPDGEPEVVSPGIGTERS